MKLLLDTHAFLWFVQGDGRLSKTARRRIEDARNDKLLSVASIWEAAIKISIGKLRLGRPLAGLVDDAVQEGGLMLLAIDPAHAASVEHLPRHHADPFDRLLVAQALAGDLTVVGSDPAFDAYGVRRAW